MSNIHHIKDTILREIAKDWIFLPTLIKIDAIKVQFNTASPTLQEAMLVAKEILDDE